MKLNRICRCVVIGTSLLLAGYGSAGAEEQQYSGFISDYSGLQKTRDPLGDPLLRMVSPRFTPANYHALIIEPVQLYPKPQPTERVSQTTLDEIAQYMNSELQSQLAEEVQITDTAGPGVARLRIAITAVGDKTEGLKPYQFIPVALILTTASRAVSGAPEQATLNIESEVTDSVNGERLLVGVRQGTGERLKEAVEGEKVVTLDALKPLIDKWIEGVTKEAGEYVKPR
jgi:Protein of unknown function (DUF3313)